MMGWPGARSMTHAALAGAQAHLPLGGTAVPCTPAQAGADPASLIAADDLAALVDGDALPARRQYLTATADLHPEALAAAILLACDAGWGCWTPPRPALRENFASADRHRRPATHLHEIVLLGVTATGATPTEAATHWRSVATRLTPGSPGHEEDAA